MMRTLHNHTSVRARLTKHPVTVMLHLHSLDVCLQRSVAALAADRSCLHWESIRGARRMTALDRAHDRRSSTRSGPRLVLGWRSQISGWHLHDVCP